MRRVRTMSTMLVLAGLALGSWGLSPLRAQSRDAGLVPDGEAPGLLLLYSGDVIGYLDPCG